MAKRKWLPCRLNKDASTIPDMADTPVKEAPAKKEKFEWADEGLSALVRVIILGWSAAILTLNYVTVPGIPQRQIDPTFIASVFTTTLATFGVQASKKK